MEALFALLFIWLLFTGGLGSTPTKIAWAIVGFFVHSYLIITIPFFTYLFWGVIIFCIGIACYSLVTGKDEEYQKIAELQSANLHYDNIAPYIPAKRQYLVEQFLANAEPYDTLEITVSISESDTKKLSEFLKQPH